MTTKAGIRADIRQWLRDAHAGSLAEKSGLICRQIAENDAWRSAATVCLFAPQAHEPDVELLWRERGERVFCYPRVNGTELDLIRVDDRAELQMSRWQLREPIHDSDKLMAPAGVDLVLVPGVAFSRQGARLGRGGGFYDRLLSRPDFRARRIGVCFERQLLDELPTEPHDCAVDLVITA